MNGTILPDLSTARSAGPRRILSPASRPVFPEDLRAWVPDSVLLGLVLEATASAEPDRRRLPALDEGGESFAPAMLSSVLAYAYATGRYGSDVIEAGLRSDAVLLYLGTRRWLPAAVLRRYRRRQREWLIAVVADVLRGAMKRAASPWKAASFGPSAASPARTSLDAAAQEDAERRVQRAVLEDTVAADI